MPKVDFALYKGREQAFVKHCLLEEYLQDWAYKVGSQWDDLVYIDGFAGPWGTNDPDHADSSFGVALDKLRPVKAALDSKGKPVGVHSLLIGLDKPAFDELDAYAKKQSRPGFTIKPFCGKFVEQIPALQRYVAENTKKPFRFIFLDPKGWAQIPMESLKPFLKDRSCEVLINLMTTHISRFLEEESRASSYEELFGRKEALETLQKSERWDRQDKAVHEYCKSLKKLCGFKYVSSAVILEPTKEKIRYFLIYATNHHKGVVVFKDAEMTAAEIQAEARFEAKRNEKFQKTSQFELSLESKPSHTEFARKLRAQYVARARSKVIKVLLRLDSRKQVSYQELYCEAMAYPLVTPDDLKNLLLELSPHVNLCLSPLGRRSPSPDKDDYVVVEDQNSLIARFAGNEA